MIVSNKRVWEVGDIVIHEDDKKIESMLMKVIDVLNAGMVKTVYIHPKGNVEFYQYSMKRLHDPLKFGMTSTVSFSQELEWRIENITKFIISSNTDVGVGVDEIRYLKGQRSGIMIALDIYKDRQSEVDNEIHI